MKGCTLKQFLRVMNLVLIQREGERVLEARDEREKCDREEEQCE